MVVSPMLSMYNILDRFSATANMGRVDRRVNVEERLKRKLSEEELDMEVRYMNAN